MRDFKTLFMWSLIGHLLFSGIMLAGSAFPKRRPTVGSVYHVQMVEPAGVPAPPAPEVSAPEAPAPAPEPAPEVRISPEEERRREEEERRKAEERRRREEEQRRRAEERERTRRELEEARKRREEEDRDRSERRQRELAELQRLQRELSEAKDVGGLRTSAGPSALPSWFANEVHNRIFSAWEPVAVRSSAEISFFISRDGGVSSINVERSSGSGPYDASCVQAVRSAGRMPELPEGVSREGVRVYVNFKN